MVFNGVTLLGQMNVVQSGVYNIMYTLDLHDYNVMHACVCLYSYSLSYYSVQCTCTCTLYMYIVRVSPCVIYIHVHVRAHVYSISVNNRVCYHDQLFHLRTLAGS